MLNRKANEVRICPEWQIISLASNSRRRIALFVYVVQAKGNQGKYPAKHQMPKPEFEIHIPLALLIGWFYFNICIYFK